ncbi:hypothetical protein Tsubulata_037792, partial [Turnera subulata]
MHDSEIQLRDFLKSEGFTEEQRKEIDVPFFDIRSILAATDNFSEEKKLGRGGFGPVYKGKFPGGQEIAVKRLSSGSGQGLEEFKNEIFKQHLKFLLTMCFLNLKEDRTRCLLLDWELRFNIILDIARGLLYLHHDSRLRVIHRDLKTSNVLLDEEMNPKISDFGLARIFGGKQTEGSTNRVVGTYGYMSPEYALEGNFSIKSDVFSFGVVLLEILSGKKNTGFFKSEQAFSLLDYTWKLWREEKLLDLMDHTLNESCKTNEFLRCVNVGLLCVQEEPWDRPTMSNVLFMLGSETATLPTPKQPALLVRRSLNSTASSSSKAESNVELTVSMISPTNLLQAFLFFSLFLHSYSRDVLTKNTSLYDSRGETLVSSGERFELGFFTPNGSSGRRYVGIWYYRINPLAVVWVANRENPVLDRNGVFSIAEDGNLNLLDGSGRPCWSTNLERSSSKDRKTRLMDNGNLVVTDEEQEDQLQGVGWQSFDNPTDTFLPGMRMSKDMALVSWKSYDDPASGNFTFHLDEEANQFVIWKRSVRYWRCGISDNVGSSNQMSSAINYFLTNFTSQMECKMECLNNCQCEAFSYEEAENSQWDASANAACWIWLEDLSDLQEEYDAGRSLNVRISASDRESTTRGCGSCGTDMIPYPLSTGSQCGDPAYFNFYCNTSTGQLSFETPSGAYRITRVDTELHKFVIQTKDADSCKALNSNVKFLLSNQSSPFHVIRWCNVYTGRFSSGVSLTGGNEVRLVKIFFLFNLFGNGGIIQRNFGLQLNASERLVKDIIDSGRFNQDESKAIDVPFFELESILAATNNFSNANKLGQGGFGPVYKAKFPGGEDIAVKRLSSGSGQGLEEFKNEDSRLRIIHRDLKTSNILLDEEMNPKISDFGLARIFGGKETAANTNRAWNLWKEDKALELLDQTLSKTCKPNEFLKTVNVGLLCVQEDPSERPSMSNILFMLGSETATLPIPKQPPFVVRRCPSSRASSTICVILELLDKSSHLIYATTAIRNTSGGAFYAAFGGEGEEIYATYSLSVSSMKIRGTLLPAGQFQLLSWMEGRKNWLPALTFPEFPCDVYGYCGPSGTCDRYDSPDTCKCLTGFQPKVPNEWNMRNWTNGCVREEALKCGEADEFVKLAGVKLPDHSISLGNMSVMECKSRCIQNCSCTAYSYGDMIDGNSVKCLNWFGDIVDLVLNYSKDRDIYIRILDKKLERSDGSTSTIDRTITVSSGKNDKELDAFSFKIILDATNKFSEENKLGRGGFGPVYKGILGNQEVAIKRLSKKSGQGAREFMNEIRLIAKLQHTNLVRLLGCCIEGEEKILGVAQGLLYLHKYSRLKVIHRDLKASNILLDEAMNPKISDFGMARIGYMAPEYALYGKFSEKSDVYSFGVLLLEIVSGKRNTDFQYNDLYPTLLGWAWGKWNEGRGLELIDQSIRDHCCSHIALKCIHVGLLCVQESPLDRPTMPSVVVMFSNGNASLPSPKEPAFCIRNQPQPPVIGTSPSTSGSYTNNGTNNEMTGDEVYATYGLSVRSFKIMATLLPDGQVQFLEWTEGREKWSPVLTFPEFPCDEYGYCGPSSTCERNDSSNTCKCLPGFQPKVQNEWNLRNWSNGCVRETPQKCGEADEFRKLEEVKLPDHSISMGNMSVKECVSKCTWNCSCTAYSYGEMIRGNSVNCLNWFGDIVDLVLNYRELPCDIYGLCGPSGTCSNIDKPNVCKCFPGFRPKIQNEWNMKNWSNGCVKEKTWRCGEGNEFMKFMDVKLPDHSQAMGSMTPSERLLWTERQNQSSTTADKTITVSSGKNDKELETFSFKGILDSTNSFSEENKLGKGGFGPVYKGIVENQEVAMKRLSKKSGQGTQEFMNEIILIAKLQHTNLVRLLGCCIEGNENILIHLKKAKMDWSKRFHIIEGVAQGLLYLHKYSRLKVIHRDLKASNVLLDEAMNPKISDFGTARMFGSDQIEAKTIRVVATCNFVSTYFSKFSSKLCQILSGKRNTDFQYNDPYPTLLGWAWELRNEGRGLELVDQSVRGQCCSQLALKCIHVGLLCIQESPLDRPTMPSVVVMLSLDNASLPAPEQPAFSIGNRSIVIGTSRSTLGSYSSNEMTISKPLQFLEWTKGRENWVPIKIFPGFPCDVYGYCGPSATCDRVDSPDTCKCLPGFLPKVQNEWNMRNWSNGCVREKALECGEADNFMKLEGVKLPDHSISIGNMSVLDCISKCMQNCSCTAYSYGDMIGGNSVKCLNWFGDIVDLVLNYKKGRDIYIRIHDKRPERHDGCSSPAGRTISISNQKTDKELDKIILKTIMDATNNFSEENKLGMGGFGPVYKSMLHTVILFGGLLLFLLDPSEKAKMDWSKRFHIIEGVAQGLLYLHKYSRLKVIHRDLKASNILLDEAMNPKISDFGMARMFGSDQTEANTNRFSEKSDVYSFGVLLLEIVSGKRNTDFQYNNHYPTLLGLAWGIWNEGRGAELIDESVRGQCCSQVALKCIHVGLLCIQESPLDRPTMPSVVVMLSNDNAALPAPKQPAFCIGNRSTVIGTSPSTLGSYSNNEMTVSE